MMELLGAERLALDWVAYCAMPPVDQLIWEERDNNLYKVMLFPMNLKHDNVKKDLHSVNSQGNMAAYLPTIKSMARYLLTHYPNKNSTNQCNDTKGDRSGKKGDNLKSELAPQEYTLETPHQMKSPALLVEKLV